MTVNSRFTNVSYITVYITAGQRLDRSFHFSKYFLLGYIYYRAKEFSIGGLACPAFGLPHPLPCSVMVCPVALLAERLAVTTTSAGKLGGRGLSLG
jgi:hypothetical protein